MLFFQDHNAYRLLSNQAHHILQFVPIRLILFLQQGFWWDCARYRQAKVHFPALYRQNQYQTKNRLNMDPKSQLC